MVQLSAVAPGSEGESDDAKSRVVASFKKRIKDGSVPLLAGSIVLLRALTATDSNRKTASHILAGVVLVGIGLRQRHHHSTTKSEIGAEEDHHSGTGTSEMRAKSHHPDTNPRDIDDPTIDSGPDDESGQITDEQGRDSGSAESAVSDSRIDDTTDVDLSEAAVADEPAEAAGPTSEQSQPTQTDSIEPEETPEADSTPAESGGADEVESGGGDEGTTEEDDERASTGDDEDPH